MKKSKKIEKKDSDKSLLTAKKSAAKVVNQKTQKFKLSQMNLLHENDGSSLRQEVKAVKYRTFVHKRKKKNNVKAKVKRMITKMQKGIMNTTMLATKQMLAMKTHHCIEQSGIKDKIMKDNEFCETKSSGQDSLEEAEKAS